MAYLKTIDNGMDEVACKRIINVPKRGIGLTTLDRISSYAQMHEIGFFDACKDAQYIDGIGRSLSKIHSFVGLIDHYRHLLLDSNYSIEQLIRDILQDTGYSTNLEEDGSDEAKGRLENIEELINKAVSFSTEYEGEIYNSESPSLLSAFLENVALVADIDTVNDETNVVLLMTMHSAKGLEFPNVYICGMEENIFPSAMALYSLDSSEIEEERRLCYVGITRAMDKLTLSSASRRMKNGELQVNAPSRFLKEIPRYLLKESASKEYSQTTSSRNRENDFPTSYKPMGNAKSKNLFLIHTRNNGRTLGNMQMKASEQLDVNRDVHRSGITL